jgi:hypothetical protein
MAKHYFTYDPEKFHFTGHFIQEEAPENSTEVPVPVCDGERFAKWEEDKWVVKHLVNDEWVDCTDELPVVDISEVYVAPVKSPEEMEAEYAAFLAEQAALENNQGE